MSFVKMKFFRATATTGIFLAALFSMQAEAQAGGACRTPDGFSYVAAMQNPAPAPAPKDKGKDGKGMGGTGVIVDRGRGMGGTGIDIANGKGIGGTGIRFEGGIAIQGRITGFGSICVDGLEVKYTNATPVQDGAQKISAADLKIGQIVSAVASPAGDALMARSIAVDTLVTGKLVSIDTARGALNVAGQKVTVTNIDKVARALTPGRTISVSGFRTGRGGILGTFIDRQPHAAAAPGLGAAAHAATQGFVTHKDASGLVVNGLKVTVPETAQVIGGTRTSIGENDRVVVIGRHEGGGITAEVVSIEHRDIPAELDSAGGAEVHPQRQGKTGIEQERSGGGHGEDGGSDGGGSGGEGSDGGGSGRDGGGFDGGGGRDGGGRPEIERPDREGPDREH